MPPVKTTAQPRAMRVTASPSGHVTALLYPAAPARRHGAGIILAHGAGADQNSALMVQFATGLAARGVATVTFNFPYTENGRRLPDRNDRLEDCWRAVIAAVGTSEDLLADTGGTLVIGGKSMGGRIASQVAAGPVPAAVAGLVLLGYPLHPPGRPDKLRAEHLGRIRTPMLFVQGSRDAFGTPAELRAALAGANASADLHVVEGGDHSFKVPKRGGASQDEVYGAVLDAIAQWTARLRVP